MANDYSYLHSETPNSDLPDFVARDNEVFKSLSDTSAVVASHGRHRAEVETKWGRLGFLKPAHTAYRQKMQNKPFRRTIIGATAAFMVFGGAGGVYAMTHSPIKTGGSYTAAPAVIEGASEVHYHAPTQIPGVGIPNATPTPGDAGGYTLAPAVAGTQTGVAETTETPGTPGDTSTAPTVNGGSLDATGTIGFIFPVKNAPVTSGFGYRYHPILHINRLHAGIDFGAPCGSPMYASEAGVVELAHYKGESGNAVIINHGDLNGAEKGSVFRTHYYHLSAYGEIGRAHV